LTSVLKPVITARRIVAREKPRAALEADRKARSSGSGGAIPGARREIPAPGAP